MTTITSTSARVAYGASKIATEARKSLLAKHGIHSAIPASLAPALIRGRIKAIDRVISVGSLCNRRDLSADEVTELLEALAAI